MKILTTVLALSYVFVGANASRAWTFDEMTREVESKFPIAEKQAETLIKMLDSQKHQPRLQSDIDRLKTHETSAGFKASDTYLYRVFKELGIPLESSAIEHKYLVSSDSPGMPEYIQPVATNFLTGLCTGYFGARHQNPIWIDKTFLANQENAAKLVNLCEKVMAIQRPVQLKIREKLNVEGSRLPGEDTQGGGLNVYGGKRLTDNRVGAEAVYGFMIAPHMSNQGANQFFYELAKNTATYAWKYSPIYLKYVQSLAQYLNEIGMKGYGYDLPSDVVASIDTILLKRSETEDLSDLRKDRQDAGEARKENGDSLNLDDLKLPE